VRASAEVDLMEREREAAARRYLAVDTARARADDLLDLMH
jgi:hypothetical protein